jgi:hypothetical protein
MQAAGDASSPAQLAPGDVYPDALAQAEAGLIAQRRAALEMQGDAVQIAVGVSGGGIRSATFALGFFQALARRNLMKHVDYLSTVSGGGYFGGFLCKLFLSAGGGNAQASLAQTTEALANMQSAPVRWLRENGRYIAPTGAGDYFSAAAIYLRNWTAVQYVVGIALLAGFLFFNSVRGWLWSYSQVAGLEALMLPKFWLSPWLIVPAVVEGFFMVPLAGAYWLTQQNRRHAGAPNRYAPDYPMIAVCLLIIAAASALYATKNASLDWLPGDLIARLTYAYVIVIGVLCAAVYAGACWFARGDDPSITRNALSHGLGRMLLAFVMATAFGLVDSFGQTAYALFMASKTSGRPIAITGLVTVVLVFLARQFAAYLSVDQSNQRKRVRIPTQVIGFVVGVALAFIVATFWAATAHAILWKGQVPYGDPGQQIIDQIRGKNPQVSLSKDNYIVVAPAAEHAKARADTRPAPILASVALALVLLINVLTGRTLTFLNLSSIQQFYAARLARAYLGASNPRRTGFGTAPAAGQPMTQDVTEAIEGDDVPFSAYRPEQHGGPIHLINVTINETLAGASQLEQRDRKGLGMAVGPCGISVARVHHAIWAGN